jgi:hypothetical protein
MRDRASDLRFRVVGDTGIEPVTSTVSRSYRSMADLRFFEILQVSAVR